MLFRHILSFYFSGKPFDVMTKKLFGRSYGDKEIILPLNSGAAIIRLDKLVTIYLGAYCVEFCDSIFVCLFTNLYVYLFHILKRSEYVIKNAVRNKMFPNLFRGILCFLFVYSLIHIFNYFIY